MMGQIYIIVYVSMIKGYTKHYTRSWRKQVANIIYIIYINSKVFQRRRHIVRFYLVACHTR